MMLVIVKIIAFLGLPFLGAPTIQQFNNITITHMFTEKDKSLQATFKFKDFPQA